MGYKYVKEWQGAQIVITIESLDYLSTLLRYELKIDGCTQDFYERNLKKGMEITGVTLSGRDYNGNYIKVTFRESFFSLMAVIYFNDKKIFTQHM